MKKSRYHWLVCVDCQKGIRSDQHKGKDCPRCGENMRSSYKKPHFVMSLDNIHNVAQWANGEYDLRDDRKDEIQKVLIGSENKSALIKKMIQMNRMSRLTKLLKVQEEVEDSLFKIEDIDSMEPREKLRALELLQRSVRDTKDFVYIEEENTMEIVAGGLQQEETRIKMKSSSRENMRYMFDETKKLLGDNNLEKVLGELENEING